MIRNSNVAKCIELPNITKKTSIEGITLEEHENYPLLKVAAQAPSAIATASLPRCAKPSSKRWVSAGRSSGAVGWANPTESEGRRR